MRHLLLVNFLLAIGCERDVEPKPQHDCKLTELKSTDHHGTRTYSYNKEGFVESVFSNSAGGDRTIEFLYDQTFRIIEHRISASTSDYVKEKGDYIYSNDKLTGLITQRGDYEIFLYTYKFTYDSENRIIKTETDFGTTHTYEYDDQGRLIKEMGFSYGATETTIHSYNSNSVKSGYSLLKGLPQLDLFSTHVNINTEYVAAKTTVTRDFELVGEQQIEVIINSKITSNASGYAISWEAATEYINGPYSGTIVTTNYNLSYLDCE